LTTATSGLLAHAPLAGELHPALECQLIRINTLINEPLEPSVAFGDQRGERLQRDGLGATAPGNFSSG
jgi:hypothetical protein